MVLGGKLHQLRYMYFKARSQMYVHVHTIQITAIAKSSHTISGEKHCLTS